MKLDQWTKERIQMLKDRYQKDGPTVLSKKMGTTRFAITAKARRLGIGPCRKCPPKGFKWTDENVQKVRNRYERESHYLLCEELGLDKGTIRRKAKEIGLRTNYGHVKAGKERAAKTESCDVTFFDRWHSDMAYLLGFIYADGCINKKGTTLSFCLSKKDAVLLQWIKKTLKVRSKIHEKTDDDERYKKPTNSVMLHVGSTLLVEKLNLMGIVNRKTYADLPFPNVPDSFLSDFIRGYLDGDGTVALTSRNVCCVNFCGSVKFIEGLKSLLVERLGLASNKINIRQGKTVRFAYVTWSSHKDLKTLYDFLYPKGIGFCLERKRRNLIQKLREICSL